MKKLVKDLLGDAVFMRRLHGWMTIFWIVMLPISILTGWIHQVAYVSSISLWALVSGHWTAWHAARVEVGQEKEHRRRQEEDIAEEVVDKVVEETEVKRK